MNASKYQKEASRTEAPIDPGVISRLVNKARLLHAGAGLCTEAGEFFDTLKCHVYYGKEIDKNHIAEEIGDVAWYLALACNALDIKLEDVLDKNIAKLRARYPEKFSSGKALNRDLSKEKEALAAHGSS